MMSLLLKRTGNLKSNKVILFVGGSGDNRDSFDAVIAKLIQTVPTVQFVTFSFRGIDEHIDFPLHQQALDLREVVEMIEGAHPRPDIVIVATSMGAYSAAHVLSQEKQFPITQCILVDPADYIIDMNRLVSESRSWSGTDTYKPVLPTASTMMNKITSNVRVDVVYFTLKNYTTNGYVPMPVRGVNNEGAVPRLNSTMVRSFYENTPAKNRGEYIENGLLPHAFMRDGTVEKNVDILAHLLIQLFK